MESAQESFFPDAIPDETTQGVADDWTEMLQLHSKETEPPADPSSSDTVVRPSEVIAEATKVPERNEPPQAMLTFVMGEHRFSDPYELGVLNEHPEALNTITSNQCLSTSAFLTPALHAVMAELRPLMIVQVAVRLTAITLRLVAKILPTGTATPDGQSDCRTEQLEPYETVRRELEQAVPYYQWHGPRNHYGRVQYLMALLEEAIRVLAVPTETLIEMLKADLSVTHALNHVAQLISDFGESPAAICGTWAAENLLPVWKEKASVNSSSITSGSEGPAKAAGKLEAGPESEGNETTLSHPHLCTTPDSDSEDELPSPSTFLRRKQSPKTPQVSAGAKVQIPKALDHDVVKPGSQAGGPN